MHNGDLSPWRLFQPLLTLVGGLVAAMIVLWLMVPSPDTRKERLGEVARWTYQLQDVAGAIGELARSDSDMLVIDYAVDRGAGLKPLARDEVARLKRKPDASERLVIAYFSIGEAEEYRPYWQDTWREHPPGWIIAENCRWPKNHLVKFWDDGWRDIIFSGAASYLAAIQDAGFDGVYLDRVDVYADIEDQHPGARARMVQFVKDLATTARARDPGFLVIVQNAEELLADASYRRQIDAVAKEDLLYGVNGTGKRNPHDMIAGSAQMLDALKRDGKPVFAVEYLLNRQTIEMARHELDRHGFVSVFPTRALDGADPVATHQAAMDAATTAPPSPETGTPEYAQARCDGVWKREQPVTPPETQPQPQPPPAMPRGASMR